MRNTQLQIDYQICSFEELALADQKLVEAAKAACLTSYAPYSHFSVGAAAALDNGEIVCGSNQENAAYPSGTCAERCTVFYANARYPEAAVTTLAIAARTEDGSYTANPITPCGACRQVLLETEHRYGKAMRILLYGSHHTYVIASCSQLLPFQFSSDSCGW
ncbi:cytidine deaminase [gut metagenome]|uniref:Cytidine deaminase n=1 Tax=gut metagenome TaxID=749906 RepID=J9GKN7_9ZZZZ